MRRWAAGLLVFLLLLQAAPILAGAVFPDVDPAWAEESIALLRARGVVEGYEDGLFRPGRPVSRAEAAKVVVILLGWDGEARALAQSTVWPRYADMRAQHWAVGYVELASDLGLFIGDENGWFRPEASITRAELVTVLGRMIARRVADPLGPVPFADAREIPAWALPSLRRVLFAGLLAVHPGDLFSPRQIVDRSILMETLRQYLRYAGGEFDLLGPVVSFSGGQLVLELEADQVTLEIPAGQMMFRNGRRGAPRAYDQAGVILGGAGEVLHVSSFFLGVGGVLERLTANRLVVRDAQGELGEYAVQAAAPVFRQGSPASLEALRPGDELLLVLDYRDGSVRAVDAVRIDGWGVVSAVVSPGRMLMVQRGALSWTVMLGPATRVVIDGNATAPEAIQPGMFIRYGQGFHYLEYAELSSTGEGE